jgi:hypothetical protein
MIKQSLALILSLSLSGCVNLKYNNGLTDIDQGRIEEKGVIQSADGSFTLPICSSSKVETEDCEKGIYFTIRNGNLLRTYVVSGSSNELGKISLNLSRSKKVTFEFYPNGEYKPLSQTNRFYYSNSIPRKDCQFTFEGIK